MNANAKSASAMAIWDRSECQVQIVAGDAALVGDLAIPIEARGLVVFAHGSGSSRTSPRNRFVAGVLQQAGFATLLVDLLTGREARIDQETREWRFNIPLLGRRLTTITEWQQQHSDLRQLPLGYFGASTGSAAALMAAAERPECVKAVVSRGGRPDLAGSSLARVHTPTLLIVGGDDTEVLELNRQALVRIPAKTNLEIIPGATHLFEEPGALEEVARLATEWCQQHLL
jgi:putative phosphoribosyl transferase